MPFLAYVLPVLPGRSERLLRTREELGERRAEYEELNRAAGLRRHLEFLERTPMGDFHIVIYELDDPSKLTRAFGDSDYDRWWVARLKDVYGVDVDEAPPPAPDVVPIWSWGRPPGEG